MPALLKQTTRALAADTNRFSSLAALVSATAAILLLGWMALAEISTYVLTREARLTVATPPRPVATSAAGRVTRNHIELGRFVRAGEVLMELESDQQRAQLSEAEARLQALSLRQEATMAELAAEEAVGSSSAARHRLALAAARTQNEGARAEHRYKGEVDGISKELLREHLISDLDALERRHAAKQSEFTLAQTSIDVEHQQAEAVLAMREQLAQVARLKRSLAEILGETRLAQAALKQAEARLAERRVLATATGHVAYRAPKEIGSVVRPGDMVASVLRDDQLKVVGKVAAAEALGRVEPGQAATMRLDGFPALDYGALAVTVTRVARESHSGLVDIEFSIVAASGGDLPLIHGLPGTVEIEVESTTPWQLVVRGVSRHVDGRLTGKDPP